MNFTDFTLDSGLQEGLAEAGYVTCMPVQEQVLKIGLEGADLYVQSQTGTGKTAAYLVTILQRLVSDPALSGKKALIMVPTRELAVQVEEEARILGSCMKLKSASFYGGVGYGGQQDLLKKGVDIIIGTPGRVIDLQQSRTMDLSQVAFLVIDEADRMFDMGFYPDLRTLIKVLPKAEERQTMLFSATLNATVKNLAWEYTVQAKEVTIEAENVTVDEIDQLLYHVSSDEKMKLLLGLIKTHAPESLLIFCNTKRMSEVVAKRLKINGYESDFIIGDLPQSKRLQVIDSFKSGSLKCLVATDVAARGIDVESLAMVINYDLPNEAENYVHRIGRTARAGKTGKAFSFCSEQDVYNLPSIEKYIEAKIPTEIATEDLLVEDKSAHVYIRTDRYDNDYADDDSGYRGGRSGDRTGGSRSGSGHGRSGPGRGRQGDNRRRSGPGSDRNAPRTTGHAPAPRSAPPVSYAGADHDAQPGNSRAPAGRGHFGDAGARPLSAMSRSGTEGGRSRDGRSGKRIDNRPFGRTDARADNRERDLSRLSFEDRMAYYKNKYGSEEAAKAAELQRSSVSGRPDDREAAPSRDRSDGNKIQQNRSGRQQQGRTRQGQAPQGRQQTGTKPAGDRGSPSTGRSGQGRNTQDRPAAGRPSRTRPEQGRPAAGKPSQTRPEQGRSPVVAAGKKPGLGGLLKKLFGKD